MAFKVVSQANILTGSYVPFISSPSIFAFKYVLKRFFNLVIYFHVLTSVLLALLNCVILDVFYSPSETSKCSFGKGTSTPNQLNINLRHRSKYSSNSIVDRLLVDFVIFKTLSSFTNSL